MAVFRGVETVPSQCRVPGELDLGCTVSRRLAKPVKCTKPVTSLVQLNDTLNQVHFHDNLISDILHLVWVISLAWRNRLALSLQSPDPCCSTSLSYPN